MNPLSFCAVRIEFIAGETDVRTVGTGFFVDSGEGVWLVTAGHNVTGRHADSGDPLDPWDYGLVPTAPRLPSCSQTRSAEDR